MEAVTAKFIIWQKSTDKNSLQFQLFIFYRYACLQKIFTDYCTIQSGIFLGWSLWADIYIIVSPRHMIRIGENLLLVCCYE